MALKLNRMLPGALRVRRTAWRVGETLITAGLTLVINLLASVVAARALGPEGRGELAAIMIWPQIFSLAFYFGLPASAIYNIKKYPASVDLTVGGIFALGLLAGLFANAVGLLVIPLMMQRYQPSLEVASEYLFLIVAPSFIIWQISLSVVRACDNFRLFNILRILIPSLILLILIILHLLNALTSVAAAWAYGSARIIALVWPLYWIWRSYRPRLPGRRYAFTHLVRYSMRSAGIDVVYAVQQFLDRLVVIAMLAPSAVGLYAVAGNLALPLQEMGRAIVLVLFPKVASVSEQRAIEITELAGRLSFTASVAACIPLFLAAPLIIDLFFGEEFADAIPVFRLLIAASLLANTSFVLEQAFMATGRPGSVSVMVVVQLVLLATLLIALVPRDGMHGAALATVVACAVGLLMRLAAFPVLLKHRVPRLLPRKSDFTALFHKTNQLPPSDSA